MPKRIQMQRKEKVKKRVVVLSRNIHLVKSNGNIEGVTCPPPKKVKRLNKKIFILTFLGNGVF